MRTGLFEHRNKKKKRTAHFQQAARQAQICFHIQNSFSSHKERNIVGYIENLLWEDVHDIPVAQQKKRKKKNEGNWITAEPSHVTAGLV